MSNQEAAGPSAPKTLVLSGVTLLSGLDTAITSEEIPSGVFLSATWSKPSARRRVTLGRAQGLRRFVACYRDEPFWMVPATGSDLATLPVDTQFLLLELEDKTLALIVPLVSGRFRASLQPHGELLEAVLDSGTPEVTGNQALVAYVAVGTDPYALLRIGAKAVAKRLGSVNLREEKPQPSFMNDFGWCTWDAFYQDVSMAKVELGLKSFRAGGVEPRFMILDDGWQSVAQEQNTTRLTRFEANQKFDHGLEETTRLAKNTYSIKTFLVWHAIHGYWGGSSCEALAEYGTRSTLRWYSPEVLRHRPQFNWEHWGAEVGRPATTELPRFYTDYYTWLAAQGVDGVKVDNQSSIEGLCLDAGGRVQLAAETRRALEESAHRFFGPNLINCMSCSNDHIYHTARSNLMRTSTDFWPNIPSSHGLHVYTNAVVSLWFGHFVQPDWDMFQSAHAAGAFHAAARAVSGSAVYVSDKPEAHDFELLRTLVLSDGSVLRASGIALPTPDCVFDNPLKDAVLLKIFNRNANGSAVVGLFNARYTEAGDPIVGALSPEQVPGLEGDRFVVFLQRTNRLSVLSRAESVEVSLDTLQAEVATLVAVRAEFTAVGLADKLNAGAAVMHESRSGREHTVQLRDGGRFLAHCNATPTGCRVDGEAAPFQFADGRLDVEVPSRGPCEVILSF